MNTNRWRRPATAELPLFAQTIAADPCRRKSGGPPTSVSAHAKVQPFKRAIYAKIIEAIAAKGGNGMTVKELAAELRTYPSNVSGRLFELRARLGWLAYKVDAAGRPVRRAGAAVLVIAGEGLPAECA